MYSTKFLEIFFLIFFFFFIRFFFFFCKIMSLVWLICLTAYQLLMDYLKSDIWFTSRFFIVFKIIFSISHGNFVGWLVFLWHINICRLFNTKSIFYINNQFYLKQLSLAWVRSLMVKNITISNYSVYSNSYI